MPNRYGPAGGPIEPLPTKTFKEQLQEYKDKQERAFRDHYEEKQREEEKAVAERKALVERNKDFIDSWNSRNPHRHVREVAVERDGKRVIERQADPVLEAKQAEIVAAERRYFWEHGVWPKEEPVSPFSPKPVAWTPDLVEFVDEINLRKNSSKAEYERVHLERAQRQARRELEQRGY